IEAAVTQAGTAAAIAESVTEVFVRRAVAGRRLAHALLFEEVPDAVQLERLILRRGYVAAIAAGLDRVRGRAGDHAQTTPAEVADAPSQTAGGAGPAAPAEVVARFIVGGIAENLVDVLNPSAPAPSDIEALISALSAFTRSALGETCPPNPSPHPPRRTPHMRCSTRRRLGGTSTNSPSTPLSMRPSTATHRRRRGTTSNASAAS